MTFDFTMKIRRKASAVAQLSRSRIWVEVGNAVVAMPFGLWRAINFAETCVSSVHLFVHYRSRQHLTFKSISSDSVTAAFP